MFALLIDPDKSEDSHLLATLEKIKHTPPDLILVGGSLLTDGDLKRTVLSIKEKTNIPVVLFPGSSAQITPEADGILFLSLLSSRNPEMLIGQQVTAAPYLRKTNLEVISTAYLLIESGKQTTASYMSNSNPIPSDKAEIAASTALAGEYLGMDLLYLDGGSGANQPVPSEMIKKVSSYTSKPLIIGGGLNNVTKIKTAFENGADVIVVGNAIESNQDFLLEIQAVIQKLNS